MLTCSIRAFIWYVKRSFCCFINKFNGINCKTVAHIYVGSYLLLLHAMVDAITVAVNTYLRKLINFSWMKYMVFWYIFSFLFFFFRFMPRNETKYQRKMKKKKFVACDKCDTNIDNRLYLSIAIRHGNRSSIFPLNAVFHANFDSCTHIQLGLIVHEKNVFVALVSVCGDMSAECTITH